MFVYIVHICVISNYNIAALYETLILKRVWQGINMTAVCNTPVNITPRINVGLISIRRLRRRLNISPTLTRVVMVQGLCPYVLYS